MQVYLTTQIKIPNHKKNLQDRAWLQFKIHKVNLFQPSFSMQITNRGLLKTVVWNDCHKTMTALEITLGQLHTEKLVKSVLLYVLKIELPVSLLGNW